MYLPFYGCAVLGFMLLVAGVWAAYHNFRVARTSHLPLRRRWLVSVYAVGVLCAATTPFQHLPTGDGWVFGLPFFAEWISTRGVVDFGVFTLPAFVGDAVVWFLVPQLVLAFMFRRQLRSVVRPSTHLA